MHPTRIFKTPDELKIAFDKYKDNLKEQSKEWVKVQYVGKDGDRVEEPQKVPMTLEGFKRYCREHYGDITEYFLNRDGLYNDFTTICSHVKEEIKENQITGGLLGFFNPSITQRLNGLVDKKETEHKGQINIPQVPNIANRK
jgi:hypothetical protein